MPKSVQGKAKRTMHDIWMAETRAEAHKAFDLFVEIKPSRQDLTIPPEVIAGIQFVDGVKEDAA